ncbi:hypothetical protein BGW38_000146 [Lunasporangiospora selenospora]|uniref:LysM domain-containing protein n=1 Tax=Lunasporangiospora selenospora TaxID=979761 RepID=A0A9P6FVI0_9FUNG|nr:hypothetical protein BGW38_000146 [Lunasporangiospora selenospora]
MKSILSLAVLALAASQAMAVVPTPVKECTKTIVITPADVSCFDFAAQHGITTDQLYAWNTKLSRKCDNLDVGAPICVSISGTASSTIAKPTSTGVTVPVTSTVTSVRPTSSASSSGSTASSSTSGAATQSTVSTPKPSNSKTTDNAAAGAFGSASSFVAAAGAIAAVAVSLVL